MIMCCLSVAKSWLGKGQVLYENYKLQCLPSEQLLDTPFASLVQFLDIPKNTERDILLTYLQNSRKSGGGRVRHMDYDMESGTALVSFMDNESR